MNHNWDQETAPQGCKEGDTPHAPLVENLGQADLTPKERDCETTTHYHHLTWHASGGLGVIYKGQDKELRREVALKFVRDKSNSGSASTGTFENEAKITAQLGHPGVVPIYGIGKTEGDARPFYVMRFIEGQKLSQVISEFHTEDRRRGRRLNVQSPEFRKLLSRMVFVCNTVQYAHHRGVIHLDIKPDNIMVGQFDETLVVDWGLAAKVSRDEMRQHPIFKSIDSDMSDLDSFGPKSTGEGPGTPAYFSPEQAKRDAELTFSTDIYLLGATLYHVLTGTAPLADASTRNEVFLRAREGEFPKPTEARPGIPRELEEICMKAMQKNARDRYATAQEMALDLENYLSDAPISVHRDQWWEKLFRWSRHHRNLTRAVATFVVVLSFLLGLFLIHNSNVAAHERMMRSNSLRVAGAFAAKGLDQEIRNRWLILDRAASDAELIRLLQKLQTTVEVRMVDGKPNLWSEAAKPVYAELHRWLEDHHEQTKLKTNASNWYLFDSKGFLIGRYPRGDADKYSKNLGANFAYRSHFHGKEQDLTDEAEAFQTASPAEKPFLSSAFDSKSDSQVKVAFSVPVRIPETNEVGKEKSKPIAVLGMNVEPGQFAFLDLNKVVDNMDVVLVDTKIANLNKDKPHPYLAPDFRGLILHHSRWKDSKDGKRFGFSEQYVRDRFEKLIFADETEVPLTPIPDHVDPTDEQPDVSRMAIYAPVPLHGDNPRDGHGLIVIIQERVANTRKPVASDSAK